LGFGRLVGEVNALGWRMRVHSQDCVWLWLNRGGEGLIWGASDRIFLKSGMMAMTGGEPAGEWSCVRHVGRHELYWVGIPRDWLQRRVGGSEAILRAGLLEWLKMGGPVAFCGLMSEWERDLCTALERAAAGMGPARLLVEARVLDWAAARLFRQRPGDGSEDCRVDERTRDPIRRALRWLGEHLDSPLDLSALAKEVGISPHHLSRRVGAETGMTLQRHLRRLRIEHACEALDSGRMNVTEVALEVGYQSLSHFAKAFRDETGRSPSEWLARSAGDDGAASP
jgi:AraC-like DNA-binding protein